MIFHRFNLLAVILVTLIGIVFLSARQSLSQKEWEAKTFEKQPPEKVMDAAGIEPGMTVGELGAGRSRFTVHLARRVGATGKILANDIDADSLAYLRERCRLAGIRNVETILGREDTPLFPEQSLDLAFMVWTYHCFTKPVAMLKGWIPALKPGARVVMVEPDPARGPGGPSHGISRERLIKEATEAGFELIQTQDFLPEDLIFVLRLKWAESWRQKKPVVISPGWILAIPWYMSFPRGWYHRE